MYFVFGSVVLRSSGPLVLRRSSVQGSFDLPQEYGKLQHFEPLKGYYSICGS